MSLTVARSHCFNIAVMTWGSLGRSILRADDDWYEFGELELHLLVRSRCMTMRCGTKATVTPDDHCTRRFQTTEQRNSQFCNGALFLTRDTAFKLPTTKHLDFGINITILAEVVTRAPM